MHLTEIWHIHHVRRVVMQFVGGANYFDDVRTLRAISVLYDFLHSDWQCDWHRRASWARWRQRLQKREGGRYAALHATASAASSSHPLPRRFVGLHARTASRCAAIVCHLGLPVAIANGSLLPLLEPCAERAASLRQELSALYALYRRRLHM